jgi:hypothetical protein
MGSVNEIDFDLEFKEAVPEGEEYYRDIAYREIMAYQNPKYHSYIGFVASIFASL